MIIYYLLILVCALFCFIWKPTITISNLVPSKEYYEVPRRKSEIRLFIIMGICVFFVIALRGNSVGTDTLRYAKEYVRNGINYFSGDFFSIKNEFGYKLLIMAGNYVGLPWRGFLFIVSAAECIVFVRFIMKYCYHEFYGIYFFITIGFFAMSLTGMRQAVAVTLLLIASELAIKKKLFPFIIVVLLAFTVHYTAICFLPCYMVFQLKYKSKKSLIIFIILPFIVRIFSFAFRSVFMMFALDKYNEYGYFTAMNYSISFSVELVAILILIGCGICLYLSDEKISQKNYQFFIMTSLYVCSIELSHAVYMATRLSYYFSFFMIVMLSNAITELKDTRIRFIAYVLLTALPFIQFMMTIPKSSLGINPYTFFWN